jgi:hypothetical protein
MVTDLCQLAKKLVNSDFKNGRVEDVHSISEKGERAVKKYAKEFFDKAVVKHREHERRRKEKKARLAEKMRGPATVGAPPADADSTAAVDMEGAQLSDAASTPPSEPESAPSPSGSERKRKRDDDDVDGGGGGGGGEEPEREGRGASAGRGAPRAGSAGAKRARTARAAGRPPPTPTPPPSPPSEGPGAGGGGERAAEGTAEGRGAGKGCAPVVAVVDRGVAGRGGLGG